MKRFLLLSAILPLLIGCLGRDSSRPADMPPLVPCTVTILSGGAPLVDAQVTFHSGDPNFKWSPSNITDSNGKADMVTYGRFSGVVEGEYAVTVTKVEREEFDPENPPRQVRVFTFTDPKFIDPAATPLRIKVEGRKTDETFDVGATERTVLRMEDAQ